MKLRQGENLNLTDCCDSTTTTELAAAPAVSARSASTVVSVGDGDTIRVNQDGENITIRLVCTDAPETAQIPWGQQSAAKLKELLPVGQAVTLRVVDRELTSQRKLSLWPDCSRSVQR